MNTRMLVIGIGVAGLAAACGSGSSGGSSGTVADKTPPASSPTATVTATPTPTITSTKTVAPTPTVTTTVTAAPVAARCLSSHLQLSLGDGDGAAGTTYQSVVFTNTGSSACHLHGYPGVSFVNSAGKIIGKPATMDSGAVKTITLAASGGKAHALLRQPDAGNFDASACKITTADRLQVYPPGETVQLFTSDTAQVCSTSAGRAGISPVEAGAGS